MGICFSIDGIRMPTLNVFARLPEMYGPSIMPSFYKNFPVPRAHLLILTHIRREIYDSYSIKLRKLDFRRNGNPSWIMHDFRSVVASSMFIRFIDKYVWICPKYKCSKHIIDREISVNIS